MDGRVDIDRQKCLEYRFLDYVTVDMPQAVTYVTPITVHNIQKKMPKSCRFNTVASTIFVILRSESKTSHDNNTSSTVVQASYNTKMVVSYQQRAPNTRRILKSCATYIAFGYLFGKDCGGDIVERNSTFGNRHGVGCYKMRM